MINTVDSSIITAKSGRIIHVENSGTVGVVVTVGVGVGVDVDVGARVCVIAKKLTVIVPGPFIVALVVAELASLNVIEPVFDDQLEKV